MNPATRAAAGPWERLLSPRRFSGRVSEHDESRNAFQHDWDRIVYSPHFRRLAGKTQVFPLPLDDHIHSRLVHSLEVATVGRSLGTRVGARLEDQGLLPAPVDARTCGDIVAAACLAHDLGNPPFGHAGEEAIREYFASCRETEWFGAFDERQQRDLLRYEGNALALRLTLQKGLDLCHATLGALVKYPCASTSVAPKTARQRSRSKHGIDSAQLESFAKIAEELGLARDAEAEHAWQRHPLAYLTEAADDVAYQVLDLEDGLRLGHVSPPLFQALLGPLSGSRPPVDARGLGTHELLERAGRVRAVAISRLASEVVEVFAERLTDIVAGRFDDALIRHIPSRPEFEAIEETNLVQCYRADEVLRLELSGSVAIRGVLAVLVEAALGGRSFTSDRIRHLHQHVFGADQPNESDYDRVLRVTDFVAGMTDHYVVRLYRELSGIRLPGGRD